MKASVAPTSVLATALETVLAPGGLNSANMQLLYTASRAVVTGAVDPGPVAAQIYRMLDHVLASNDTVLLIHGLKILATLCHCETVITEILFYLPAADTENRGTGDVESNLFSQFNFSAEHDPSERLIMLIQGLATFEVYRSNLSLFHAAILALEGLTFYSQGKKKVLLRGGLQTIASLVEELHMGTDALDMRKSNNEITLAILETLSNIITFRFARVLTLDNGERVIELCAESLYDSLLTALVTADKAAQTCAIAPCILPCIIESAFFYDHIAQNEQAINALFQIAISGGAAGNRAALLSLLVLCVDSKDPSAVTKIALHGEVGEAAERAQAEAEAAFNDIRSRSPSPMRQLYKSKALLSVEAGERCDSVLEILRCLLDHEAYISLSMLIKDVATDRCKLYDIFHGTKLTLQAEIEELREAMTDLLFSLSIEDSNASLADQRKGDAHAKTAPRPGGLNVVRSIPRSGAQSRLEMHSTGHRSIAFRKVADHMSIDLSKKLF